MHIVLALALPVSPEHGFNAYFSLKLVPEGVGHGATTYLM